MNIRNTFELFGINKAVFYGVLSKLWYGAAGIITVLLIVKYFSPELQGYYFTFYSLLALQVFVELGLTNVIVNFASHEWAKLDLDKEGRIIGEQSSLLRLKSLALRAIQWYTAGAIILIICLSAAGYIFFSSSRQTGIHWSSPWLSLCIITSLNICLIPLFALLEGCNQVSQVYLWRFIQSVLQSTFTWTVIIMGGGLWAPAIANTAVFLGAVIFLYRNYLNYFRSLLLPPVHSYLNWSKEVLPMQWRIAVSWLSGYFFFSLFTPVLFRLKGPVAAGQMGITWNMINALSMIGSMWIVTRAPQFGILIANKAYDELDKLLIRSTILAVGIVSFGSIVILSVVSFVYQFHFNIADRFLPPFPTALFLMATILMQFSYAQSTYLRAHKKEPFMGVSVFSSLLMAVFVFIGAKVWGGHGVAIAYFSVITFFAIPYGTVIWLNCRKEWHFDAKIDPAILPTKGLIDE